MLAYHSDCYSRKIISLKITDHNIKNVATHPSKIWYLPVHPYLSSHMSFTFIHNRLENTNRKRYKARTANLQFDE